MACSGSDCLSTGPKIAIILSIVLNVLAAFLACCCMALHSRRRARASRYANEHDHELLSIDPVAQPLRSHPPLLPPMPAVHMPRPPNQVPAARRGAVAWFPPPPPRPPIISDARSDMATDGSPPSSLRLRRLPSPGHAATISDDLSDRGGAMPPHASHPSQQGVRMSSAPQSGGLGPGSALSPDPSSTGAVCSHSSGARGRDRQRRQSI